MVLIDLLSAPLGTIVLDLSGIPYRSVSVEENGLEAYSQHIARTRGIH